jgi:hypothetical protein
MQAERLDRASVITSGVFTPKVDLQWEKLSEAAPPQRPLTLLKDECGDWIRRRISTLVASMPFLIACLSVDRFPICADEFTADSGIVILGRHGRYT